MASWSRREPLPDLAAARAFHELQPVAVGLPSPPADNLTASPKPAWSRGDEAPSTLAPMKRADLAVDRERELTGVGPS